MRHVLYKVVFLSLTTIYPALSLVYLHLTNKRIYTERNNNIVVSFIIACSLSAILMTRVPDGDLNRYILWNELAQTLSLQDYLYAFFFREPGFLLLTYFISNSPLYSVEIYLFISISITYFCIILAVLQVCQISQIKNSDIIFVLIFVSLWGPLLSLSSQLIRQVMAGGLFLVLVSNYLYNGKINWKLFILPIFFHLSILLMLLIFYTTTLQNRTRSIFLFIGSATILKLLSPLLTTVPLVGVLIFSRIADPTKGADLESLGITEFALIFGLLILNISIKIKCAQIYQAVFVSDMMLATFLIIFIFSLIGATEMSVRYFFYVYFLMFLLIPYVFRVFKPTMFISFMSTSLAALSFTNSIIFGEWSYEMHIKPLISPLLAFL